LPNIKKFHSQLADSFTAYLQVTPPKFILLIKSFIILLNILVSRLIFGLLDSLKCSLSLNQEFSEMTDESPLESQEVERIKTETPSLENPLEQLYQNGSRYHDSNEEKVVKAMMELATEGIVQLPSRNVARKLISSKSGIRPSDVTSALNVLVAFGVVLETDINDWNGQPVMLATFRDTALKDWGSN
jgi:hypothetical protein